MVVLDTPDFLRLTLAPLLSRWGETSPSSGASSPNSGSSSSGGSSPSSSTSSLENVAPSRRQTLVLAGRARRQRESSLIKELGDILPTSSLIPPDQKGRPLDKATILRLSLSYIKLKWVIEWFTLPRSKFLHQHPHEELEDIQNLLGSGFSLILSSTGQIVYACPSSLNWLGLSSVDIIGKSVYECVHPSDYNDMDFLLRPNNRNPKLGVGGFAPSPCSQFIRLQLGSRKPRQACKVFHFSGKYYETNIESCGSFWVGLATPIPHPGDNHPQFIWSSDQIFTSVVSPDFKCATFSYSSSVPVDCQSAITRHTGFLLSEAAGISCYEMIHPGDSAKFANLQRTLYFKGQATEVFRCLRKTGGYIEMYSETSLVDSNGRVTTKSPSAIICRNHVLNVYDTGEIIAEFQLRAREAAEEAARAAEEYFHGNSNSSPLNVTDFGMGVQDLIPLDELEVLDEYLKLAGC